MRSLSFERKTYALVFVCLLFFPNVWFYCEKPALLTLFSCMYTTFYQMMCLPVLTQIPSGSSHLHPLDSTSEGLPTICRIHSEKNPKNNYMQMKAWCRFQDSHNTTVDCWTKKCNIHIFMLYICYTHIQSYLTVSLAFNKSNNRFVKNLYNNLLSYDLLTLTVQKSHESKRMMVTMEAMKRPLKMSHSM